MSTVLIVTGALTALAGIGVFAPGPLLNLIFGTTAAGATTILLARHWSLLLALVGGLLIYAGFHTEIRVPVMIIAIIEKLAIGLLVIASPLRKRLLSVAIVGADGVMAALYIIFLAQRQ